MDNAERVIRVQDQTGFDPVTLMPTQNKVVTFMVGHHGPFTLVYKAADYNGDRVLQDMAAQVATLRHIGAISQG